MVGVKEVEAAVAAGVAAHPAEAHPVEARHLRRTLAAHIDRRLQGPLHLTLQALHHHIGHLTSRPPTDHTTRLKHTTQEHTMRFKESICTLLHITTTIQITIK